MDYKSLENLVETAVLHTFSYLRTEKFLVRSIRAKGDSYEAIVDIPMGHKLSVAIQTMEQWESVAVSIWAPRATFYKPKHWLPRLDGNGGWELVGPFGFHPRAALPKSASDAQKRNPDAKVDRILDRLHLLIPRQHREWILGDLREDIAALREKGKTEKMLCRYVYWQVLWAAVEKLKPWNWAAFAWLVHKLIH